jgi:microcystin-dependent protein
MSNARRIANAGASAAGGLAPTGTVLPFAGSAAPTGWLLCFGQAVSRTTFASLFTAISTTYGTGDGSTTFGIPDLRGRIAGGKDDMGGSAASRLTSGGSGVNGASLGATGGAQTHTLTTAQIPSHAHSYVGGANGAGTGTVGAAGQSANGYTMNTLNAGSDQAHNNTQPTIVLNYIIKT